MKKIILPLILILSLVFTLSACQDGQKEPDSAPVRTVTDSCGRRVEIPQAVRSVVCVNVGSLRFTTYLGAQDLVAGVEINEQEKRIATPFSYVNHDLFASLPVTGNNGETYDEEIIALSPDIIVASFEKDEADALQSRLGIPVVAIPLVDDMFSQSCYDALTLLGEVYGRQDRAGELVQYIQGVYSDLQSRTADIPQKDRPIVYPAGISFKGTRGFGGTEAGYAPLAAIGAVNPADSTGMTGAIDIDVEQVLSWDPDIILIDLNGLDLIREDYAKNPDFYSSLTAVKEGRVYSQIAFRSFAVNAELAMADAYYAGSVVFPRQFSDIDPIEKADEIFTMMLGQPLYSQLLDAGYGFSPIILGQ